LASKGAPSHSIIFVSKIDQKTVDNVKSFVVDLKNKNCKLTFVTLGASVNVSLLKQLSQQIIEWDIDQFAQPTNWSEQFESAYGCSN
jgi:hypothetical protein